MPCPIRALQVPPPQFPLCFHFSSRVTSVEKAGLLWDRRAPPLSHFLTLDYLFNVQCLGSPLSKVCGDWDLVSHSSPGQCLAHSRYLLPNIKYLISIWKYINEVHSPIWTQGRQCPSHHRGLEELNPLHWMYPTAKGILSHHRLQAKDTEMPLPKVARKTYTVQF